MIAVLIRLAMIAAHRARGIVSAVTGGRQAGAHAIVLTSADCVVLVRLTYVSNWHLPGGGRKKGETAKDAVLRELREEIGLRAWGSIERLANARAAGGERPDTNSVFVVRGASYEPRWSLEIAEVREFDLSSLPSDLLPWAKAVLERLH